MQQAIGNPNIFFVNHSEKACGVQQYGRRVADILKKSQTFNLVYLEPSSLESFINSLGEYRPKVIVYNYLSETMPWLHQGCINYIRSLGIPQGLIVHNIGYSTAFDFYLHQDPYYVHNGNNFSLLRPLFEFNKPIPTPTGKPRFGSFGFAFKVKRHEEICQLVNAQFDEAEINLHITLSHFRPNVKELEEVKSACLSRITKPGITVNFTSDFKDDEGMLDFLAANHLNIFLYHHYHHYNGISSVIDYALSVKRPIAVCKSNMFSHINGVQPSICIEDSPLLTILQNGTAPIEKFYQEWSNENFVKHFEGIINQL